MNKLKIYACSGVGKVDGKYDYWTDNTNTACNTQAVNNLLSLINLNFVEATHLDLSEDEVLDRLDQVDLYSVCLYCAQRYSDNTEELHRAGHAIGVLLSDGRFECDDLTNDGRDANLDAMFAAVDEQMKIARMADAEWMSWWKENVEDLNQVGMSEREQQIIMSSTIGVGASGDVDYSTHTDLSKYLNDSAEYFLYTFYTDEQIKHMPALFARKRKTQRNIYQYCLSEYKRLGGTQSSMDNIIRAGIVAVFDAQPENVTKKMYDECFAGGSVGNPIAFTAAQIVAIIGAVLSAVASIIVGILSCVAKVKAAEAASIDNDLAAQDAPNPEDYPDDLADVLSGKGNSTVWILGAAVLAVLMFRRN